MRHVEPATLQPYAAAAERAALTYVVDAEPGIRRKRHGKHFGYVDADGAKVTDVETLARIRSLAIPPAWEDVWICPEAAGHIQATGRDQKGRKQYRYHPAWTACRDEAKFSSLSAFGGVLPQLRDRVDADLRKRGLPRERVIATVVWLLDNTLIRIGNDRYAKTNRSFGLTTLRSRHVEVEGSRLRFSFVGKSGQKWDVKFSDRRVAPIVRSIQELPGQRLFKYLDDDGTRREVHSHDVNAYIAEAIGSDYTSKHFRTWGATVSAALWLAEHEPPPSKREQARILNKVVDQAAQQLRNTRTVCRRCYIHPLVLESWSEGRLHAEISDLRRRLRAPLAGLDQDESTVLRWLRRQEAQSSPG